MITRSQATEMAEVYDQVEAQFRELLRDGKWHTLPEARECLSPDLTEAAYRHNGGHIHAEQPERLDAIQGIYGTLLVREIADWLGDQGLCECRHESGVDRFRLASKSAGARAGVQDGAKEENPRERHTASTRKRTERNQGKNEDRSANKPAARSGNHNAKASTLDLEEDFFGLDDLVFPETLSRAESTKDTGSKKPTVTKGKVLAQHRA